MTDILSVRALTKTYPNGTRALTDVSFNVKRGEFLAIIGLSGSGKSTLLRCLNRLQAASGGDIIFRGHNGEEINVTNVRPQEIPKVRRMMAMIFQHFNLVPRHSVLNNVLYGALAETSIWRAAFGFFANKQREKAIGLLSLVGIKEKARFRATQLSGGQQQRVAIARALMQSPDVLLADEPVASLDPATCHVVMEYLRKVNQELGLTVICNLHFLSLVRQYATRVIALKDGRIVFEGLPGEITDDWFRQIYGEDAKEVQIK